MQVRRPEIDIQGSPFGEISPTLFFMAVFKSNPQFEDVVRLTSQLALGMPYVGQVGLHVCLASVWILGI